MIRTVTGSMYTGEGVCFSPIPRIAYRDRHVVAAVDTVSGLSPIVPVAGWAHHSSLADLDGPVRLLPSRSPSSSRGEGQAALDQVVGNERLSDFSDEENLPYISALT